MFTSNSGTGSNAYRNVGVESMANTGAPHELILMLFNGARAAIAEAKGHMLRRETAAKGVAISHAMNIIDGGLKASLDVSVGGELAQNLSDLYVYMGQRLYQANRKNDSAALDEVAALLQQLGDAWSSIGAKAATVPAAKTVPAAAKDKHAAAADPAQIYGATGPGRIPAGHAAAPGPSHSSASAAPTGASPQKGRLAAAYGVR